MISSSRLLVSVLALGLVGWNSEAHASRSPDKTQPGIPWFEGDFEGALKQARAQERLLCLQFWATWSPWSEKMDVETLPDPAVQKALSAFVCYRVVADTDEAKRLMPDFALRAYPTFFFLNGAGQQEDSLVGFHNVQDLTTSLARIIRGDGLASTYRKELEATPNDHGARFRLATRLATLGLYTEYHEILDYWTRVDPGQLTVPMREIFLAHLVEKAGGCLQDPEGPILVEGMVAFLEKETDKTILFAGWRDLARIYTEMERPREVCRAYRTAWKLVPPMAMQSFGNDLAYNLWMLREQISKSERRFAMKVAQRALKDLDGLDPRQEAAYLDTLACVYFMNGKPKRAVSTLEKAIALDPNTEIYRTRLEAFVSPSTETSAMRDRR